jgi:hypothetical protein
MDVCVSEEAQVCAGAGAGDATIVGIGARLDL